MRSDKWEYKKIKAYSSTSVWGLYKKKNDNEFLSNEII